MKNILTLSAILVFCSVTTVLAEVSLKAEVDKTHLATDQVLTYKLKVTSTGKNTPKPNVPKFEGFNVVSQMQSSNVSFVKNEVKTTLEYIFILAPKDAGKFTIKPGTLKYKNKSYSTDSFDIEVTQGRPKPKTYPEIPQEPRLEFEGPHIIL